VSCRRRAERDGDVGKGSGRFRGRQRGIRGGDGASEDRIPPARASRAGQPADHGGEKGDYGAKVRPDGCNLLRGIRRFPRAPGRLPLKARFCHPCHMGGTTLFSWLDRFVSEASCSRPPQAGLRRWCEKRVEPNERTVHSGIRGLREPLLPGLTTPPRAASEAGVWPTLCPRSRPDQCLRRVRSLTDGESMSGTQVGLTGFTKSRGRGRSIVLGFRPRHPSTGARTGLAKRELCLMLREVSDRRLCRQSLSRRVSSAPRKWGLRLAPRCARWVEPRQPATCQARDFRFFPVATRMHPCLCQCASAGPAGLLWESS